MSRFIRLRALAGLLVAVLTSFVLVAAPAQAAPRSPDPEAARLQVAHVAGGSTVSAAPASVDSDVYAYALTPTFATYFVAAGHLTLHLASHSSTRYTGSFVDYVGNTSYKASADLSNASAPTLTFASTNGTFRFKVDPSFGGSSFSGTGLKVPSRLKSPAREVYLNAAAHTVRSASYKITLSERSGAIADPFAYAGTLTLVYDTNGRISGGQVTVTDRRGRNVTHGLSNSGYYSTGYFYTVAKVDKSYFGLSGSFTGTSLSGFAFSGGGAKTSQWVFSATP